MEIKNTGNYIAGSNIKNLTLNGMEIINTGNYIVGSNIKNLTLNNMEYMLLISLALIKKSH